MKLFRPWLLEEYGKYFESDKVLIDKVLNNCTLQSTKVIDLLIDSSIGIFGAFEWDTTPEGMFFWQCIYYHEAKIIKKDY